MVVNPKKARPLTHIEIAKIVSSVLGSCLAWCDVEEVVAALDHLVEAHDAVTTSSGVSAERTTRYRSLSGCDLVSGLSKRSESD